MAAAPIDAVARGIYLQDGLITVSSHRDVVLRPIVKYTTPHHKAQQPAIKMPSKYGIPATHQGQLLQDPSVEVRS